MNPESHRFSRRTFLKGMAILPAAFTLSTMIPEGILKNEKDLSEYEARTIAHNASNIPDKLDRAIRSAIPHIEVDISNAYGQLVVAHDSKDYDKLLPFQQAIQNPYEVFKKIYVAGKHAFLDLKDNTKGMEIYENLPPLVRNDFEAMASSNNHKDLDLLKEKGFTGKIFYSIGTEPALDKFFEENSDKLFENHMYGVSIHQELLGKSTVDTLKSLGLLIAAWSPDNEEEIKRCLHFGADYVTSDHFHLLDKIRQPEEIFMTQIGPHLPDQG